MALALALALTLPLKAIPLSPGLRPLIGVWTGAYHTLSTEISMLELLGRHGAQSCILCFPGRTGILLLDFLLDLP